MLSFVQIDMQAIESHKMLTGNMSAMFFLSAIPKLDIERIIQNRAGVPPRKCNFVWVWSE